MQLAIEEFGKKISVSKITSITSVSTVSDDAKDHAKSSMESVIALSTRNAADTV